MMLAFVLIAGSLAAGAAALVLLPLVRRREDARPAAAISAGIVLFGLLLGGGAMYAIFSNHDWSETASVADTPAASAARLAKELSRNPERLEGWLALGEKYFELQQFPLAMRAFQRADRLANGENADALTGLAESMLAQDFENIRGPAGRLFERVLEMRPNDAKALLYSALAAMGRGETASARDRFQRMLALNPREEIRAIIEKQLQAIDAVEGPAGGSEPAAGEGASVQVRVSVSPKLRYEPTGQAALFVAARDPSQPGPPFAAKRLPLTFPVEVTLTAADAMLPGRAIKAGQQLEVVARISLTGQPTSSSGDLFGRVGYHVGRDGKLEIVIDQAVP
jgi:cytochrome c-type biogenesis protein CcmH